MALSQNPVPIRIVDVAVGYTLAGATVVNPGTGYQVSDVLFYDGTCSPQVQVSVVTVSGGGVTGVQPTALGPCTSIPSNPVAMDGGSGSGCTLNLTWLRDVPIALATDNVADDKINAPSRLIDAVNGVKVYTFQRPCCPPAEPPFQRVKECCFPPFGISTELDLGWTDTGAEPAIHEPINCCRFDHNNPDFIGDKCRRPQLKWTGSIWDGDVYLGCACQLSLELRCVCATQFASTVEIFNGGTGFTVNDTLTVSGGTFTTAATLTVDAVDGSGVITAVSIDNPGQYSVTPTNPVSVTGGTGTGANFNLAWSYNDDAEFFLKPTGCEYPGEFGGVPGPTEYEMTRFSTQPFTLAVTLPKPDVSITSGPLTIVLIATCLGRRVMRLSDRVNNKPMYLMQHDSGCPSSNCGYLCCSKENPVWPEFIYATVQGQTVALQWLNTDMGDETKRICGVSWAGGGDTDCGVYVNGDTINIGGEEYNYTIEFGCANTNVQRGAFLGAIRLFAPGTCTPQITASNIDFHTVICNPFTVIGTCAFGEVTIEF